MGAISGDVRVPTVTMAHLLSTMITFGRLQQGSVKNMTRSNNSYQIYFLPAMYSSNDLQCPETETKVGLLLEMSRFRSLSSVLPFSANTLRQLDDGSRSANIGPTTLDQ